MLFENVSEQEGHLTGTNVQGTTVRNDSATGEDNEEADEFNKEDSDFEEHGEEEFGDGNTIGCDGCWVRLKHDHFHQIEEQLGIILELAGFCVLDAISLGFFPFRGAVGLTCLEEDNFTDVVTRTALFANSGSDDLVQKLAPESI